MSRRVLKKMGLIVASLAFAGVLAATAALADGLSQRGSFFGFLARSVPMALALPVLMVAFLAACDWCLKRIDGGREEFLAKVSEPPPAVRSHRGPRETCDADLRPAARGGCRPNTAAEDEPLSLRFARAHQPLGGKKWIGQ